ncbi:MAG: CoA-binding protein [Ignavibacteria bacterium]|nr:CoA-binding protein [Ignavibacteria bacterium]
MNFNQIFQQSKVIAVVGISDKPNRDSGRIAVMLQQRGFTVYGIHPILNNVFGIPVYPSLKDIPESIDIIDLFLSGDKLPSIQDDIIAAHPPVVWFQLGVHNDSVKTALQAKGISVIEDYCIAVEVNRAGISK